MQSTACVCQQQQPGPSNSPYTTRDWREGQKVKVTWSPIAKISFLWPADLRHVLSQRADKWLADG